MKYFLVLLSVLVTGTVTAACAFSETPSGNVYRLVITAQRLPQAKVDYARAASHIEVIAGEEAQNTCQLKKLFSCYAGAAVQDSGIGLKHIVNLRGFADKANTIVLVDGIKINDANNSWVLWDSIIQDNISRIEVIQGAPAFIYGEGALGGAINIVTKKGDTAVPMHGAFNITGTGQNGYKGSFSFRQQLGPVSYNLSSNKTNGSSLRRNSAYDVEVFSGRIGIDAGALSLSYDRNYTGSVSDIPGPLSQGQYLENPSFSSYGSTHNYEEKLWSNSAVARYSSSEEGDIAVTWFDRKRAQSSDVGWGPYAYDIRSAGWIVDYQYNGAVVDWSAGYESSQENVDVASYTSSTRRTLSGVYTSLGYDASDALTISTALRYDRARVTYNDLWAGAGYVSGVRVFEGISPFMGASYYIGDRHKFYLNYGNTFKIPPHEDFGAVLPPYTSNERIKPQTAYSSEIGYELLGEQLNLGVSCFHTYVENEILFNPVNGSNENFNTRRQGLETFANWRVADSLLISLRYNQTGSRLLSSDSTGTLAKNKSLPYVFDSQFSSQVTVKPADAWNVTLKYTAAGPYYPVNDYANLYRQKGYYWYDLSVAWDLPWGQLYAGIDNLFDARYPSLAAVNFLGNLDYYPADGRRLYTGLRVDI